MKDHGWDTKGDGRYSTNERWKTKCKRCQTRDEAWKVTAERRQTRRERREVKKERRETKGDKDRKMTDHTSHLYFNLTVPVVFTASSVSFHIYLSNHVLLKIVNYVKQIHFRNWIGNYIFQLTWVITLQSAFNFNCRFPNSRLRQRFYI